MWKLINKLFGWRHWWWLRSKFQTGYLPAVYGSYICPFCGGTHKSYQAGRECAKGFYVQAEVSEELERDAGA